MLKNSKIKKHDLTNYYFVENGIVIYTTDLYELAYDYMLELLKGRVFEYIDIRDSINNDIVIRDFGHTSVTLHFSYKNHYRKHRI